MNNYERALEAVADAIVKQAEQENKPEALLLLAQAAAAIVAADKMASGNLVDPTGHIEEMMRGNRLTVNVESKGQIIPAGGYQVKSFAEMRFPLTNRFG